nr:CHASE domain-containing protein [uncultured Roseateles sp.]
MSLDGPLSSANAPLSGKLQLLGWMPALLCFTLGLVLTGALYVYVDRYQLAQVQDAFRRDTEALSAQAQSRLQAHLETLLSLRGFFSTLEQHDEERFHRFLSHLDLQKHHPGFQAIQFVRRVPEPDLQAFIQHVRRDTSLTAAGHPGFDIRPKQAHDTHYVIEYNHPMAGNEAAFGLDLAALPTHLRALEVGRDIGQAVATERVKLVQDTGSKAGFVVRLPVYAHGMPLDSVAQRRAALLGFGAIVYRIDDLMLSLIDSQLIPHLRIRIKDLGYANEALPRGPASELFDSNGAYDARTHAGAELPALQARLTLPVAQRQWEFHFVARDGARYRQPPAFRLSIAVSGLIISALIASLVVALARRRLLSNQLSASLAEQRAILDTATVGIELIQDRIIMACNQGMADILGYRRSELTGQSTRIKFINDQAFRELGEAAYPVMADGSSWIGDIEWLRKDGSKVWCQLHGKYIDSRHPERGSIWVNYDITAQKQADAALQAANRGLAHTLSDLQATQQQLVLQEKMAGLGTLTAGVAHEINNPVNFAHVAAQNLQVDLREFQGFVRELVQADEAPEVLQAFEQRFATLSSHVDTMLNGTQRIKTIVRDLRTFTRQDATEKSELRISACLHSTLNLVRAAWLDRVEFSLDIRDDPLLPCWPALLNQVFMNLIVNGCQAIAERQRRLGDTGRGHLKITQHSAGAQLLIAIADDGIGISPQTQDHVLEPFFTTKVVGEGTGLGLSIAYGIVEKHGGSLSFTSDLGHGSCFTVSLPMA